MSHKLFCIIGVSGVGKTTVRNHIVKRKSAIEYLPSYTTRPPRQNEINGNDYFFISKPEFEKLISDNELLEWEKHFGNYYGISKQRFSEKMQSGISVIKEIAIGGYQQIVDSLKSNINVYTIYILPENIYDVLDRLSIRGDQDREERRKSFLKDFDSKALCNSIVISRQDKLEELCHEVEIIITKELNK